MSYETDGGWKVKIKGKSSKESIAAAILNSLGELESKLGVQEYGSVNVYMQIYKDEQKLAIFNDQNQCIKGTSSKSSENHKTVVRDSDGSNKVLYCTQVDYSRLQNSINSKPSSVPWDTYKTVYVNAIKEKREAFAVARQIELEKVDKKHLIEREKLRLTKQAEQESLQKFRALIETDLGITTRSEFNRLISSFRKLNSTRGKLKYLSENEIPLNGDVFRVTYRTAKGTAGTVKIFNSDHVLLKKIEKTIDVTD